MSQDYRVRRVRREDEEAVAGLWADLLREQSALEDRFAPADDAVDRWKNDFPFWVREEDRRLFVAEDTESGGGLVGFITAHRSEVPPVYRAAFEVYLSELYVRPEVRGRGVGRRLVEAVRTWAGEEGATRLRLSVLARNEAGQAFWKAQGARPFAVTLTMDLGAEETAREETSNRRKLGF